MASQPKTGRPQIDPIAIDMAGVCAALMMSEGAIRNVMCREHDPLPSYKLGEGHSSTRRFPVREVKEWAARQAAATAPVRVSAR